MSSHSGISIKHAPVEISMPVKLQKTPSALFQLLFFIFHQAYPRFFSYSVTPLTTKQRFHCDLVLRIITHHITVFWKTGYLFIKNIETVYPVCMSKVVAGSVHLISGIFDMCYSI